MGIKCFKQQIPDSHIPAFTYQHMIKYINNSPIKNNYIFLDVLGKGTYAQVRKIKTINGQVFRAVKIIDRKKHNKIQALLLGQYDILKEMDHPNILKIFQIYQQSNFYYIVSQLCPGKQLFELIKQKKQLKQEEIAKIIFQIASAIQYLNSKGIMHRDLKPQNIMYDTKTGILKLLDFGCALRYDNQQMIARRRVGTSYYIAPEVVDKKYNQKCDVWSLGIILYVLFCSTPPFIGKNDQQIFKAIKIGQYNFKNKIWENVSSQAKMLLTQLLIVSPQLRLNINQVMKSDWIKKNIKQNKLNQSDRAIFKKALTNMQKFNQIKPNKIQGAVFVFIVNFIKDPNDQIQLQKCFRQLDLNGDGILSLQELAIGLQKFLKVSNIQAQGIARNIFKRIDTNNSGFIDYSEFIVAANNIEMTATPQNLELAFDYMDQDKNGYLSLDQIQTRLGQNIPKDAYQKMLKSFQQNKKGQISKKIFVDTMIRIMNKKT